MDYLNGIYEAQKNVNLRREPRVVEYRLGKNIITNQVGMLSVGQSREIHSITTNSKGETWGRVSMPDASGIAVWVCIRTLNTEFMKPLSVVEAPAPTLGLEARVSLLEAQMKVLLAK